MDNASKIWMDGELVNWDDAKVHVLTHTLHYGVGVFEGIRCYKTADGPAIFRLKDHVDRLFNSAHIMRIKIPFTREDIVAAINNTVSENNFESCYIRPLVFLGDNKRGLNCRGIDVHTAVATWHWGTYLGEEALSKGISVKVSSFPRHHINVTMIKAKTCGNYVNSIMAKLEAVEDGYDEALLLGVGGTVAEGSGENVFIVRNGELITPPTSEALEGITRDCVIRIAADNGIKVREKSFTRDELYICEEAFFCGTAAEITPIREMDRRIIGNGEMPGPITRTIQKIYFDSVQGKNKYNNEWLHYIKV